MKKKKEKGRGGGEEGRRGKRIEEEKEVLKLYNLRKNGSFVTTQLSPIWVIIHNL